MTTHQNHPNLRWIKSSYSNGGGGDCLEWAPQTATTGTVPVRVPVRDSKAPHGPTLAFPDTDWTTFVTAIKHETLTA